MLTEKPSTRPPSIQINDIPKFKDETFIVHSGSDQIGGIAIQLLTNGSKTGIDSMMIDFGAKMGITGRYFGSSNDIKYSSGLQPLINFDLIPAIPGFYRSDIPNHPRKIRDITDPLRLQDNINEKEIEKIIRKVRILQEWNPTQKGICLTHHHWDHVGNIPYVNEDIEIIASTPTWRIIQAMEEHWGADWKREVTSYRLRSETKYRGGFKIITRPWKRLMLEKETRVGNFRIHTNKVDHSAIDTNAIEVILPSGKIIHYTGDLRAGEHTTRYIQEIKKVSPDILFIDGTNVGSSKGKNSEEIVSEEIQKSLEIKKHTHVIMVAPRNFERIKNIFRLAHHADYEVYIPLVLAFYLDNLHELQKYDHRMPKLKEVSVYINPTKSGKYEELDYPASMRRIAMGILDDIKIIPLNEIGAVAKKKSVIITTSQSQIHNLYGQGALRHKGTYIHSSSGVYEEKGAIDRKQLLNTLRKIGYEFVEIHASGHASEEELQDFISKINPKIIVPFHTQNPQRFKELIEASAKGKPKILTNIIEGYPYTIDGNIY